MRKFSLTLQKFVANLMKTGPQIRGPHATALDPASLCRSKNRGWLRFGENFLEARIVAHGVPFPTQA
jgi:hypothetical protein